MNTASFYDLRRGDKNMQKVKRRIRQIRKRYPDVEFADIHNRGLPTEECPLNLYIQAKDGRRAVVICTDNKATVITEELITEVPVYDEEKIWNLLDEIFKRKQKE